MKNVLNVINKILQKKTKNMIYEPKNRLYLIKYDSALSCELRIIIFTEGGVVNE